jgi:hypothetical protein
MVSIAGNSLQRLAPAIAGELGPVDVVTSSGNGPLDNQITASSRIDTEAPTEKYGGWYAFARDGTLAGQQGRVKKNGFVGASGTYSMAANFTLTPASGTTWEFNGTMPRIDQDGLTGIRTCINRALRKLWIIDRIDIAATSGVTEYDLASYWWASKRRFRRLLDPDPGGSGHQRPASQSWQVVPSGDLWTLELGSGYATGETFSLEVERPANSRIFTGGVWADQASPVAGLSAETDACLGEWNAVLQCSLYECMKQLAVQAGGNRKAYWAGRAAEQRAIVSVIKAFDMDSVEESLGEGQSDPSAGESVGDYGLFSRGWS